MATLIAYQSGDWTGATTFKTLVGGTGSEMLTITASTNTTTSNVASANFTITNTHVVEGFALHCNRVNTTGTVTVGLYKGTTLEREVVVNASDLPVSPSWVFFTFATTLTADGSSTYNVRVRGSSAGNATFFRDATAGNWARALRRSTTATIATTDLTIIARELTGQGTNNGTITVTMNSTASTAYGECNIGAGGVLSYGTSASTNYILDLAGNLNVWGDGTLNIGTSGTRIPSTSTALLEFTNAVNVDRGLEVRAGGTCNMFGATKTTTQTLLTADAASGQKVVTVADTSGWVANDVIALASTTRTASQSEKATISTVDSGTQITTLANLTNTHHGVAPYQGEVVNLTRNVVVRGTSQSLCAYVNCANTSSFTAEYAEFSFLGSGTSSKRGIDSATTSAGTFSMKFCSMYDVFFSGTIGINTTGTSGSPVIEDNVLFVNTSFSGFQIGATSGSPSFQRNCVIQPSGSSSFLDIGGTIKDNRFVGFIVAFSEAGAVFGTVEDNIVHSVSNTGFVVSQDCFGTVDGVTAWRCNQGLDLRCGGYRLTNIDAYHNGTSLQINAGGSQSMNGILIDNSTFNGGSGAGLAQTTTQIVVNNYAGLVVFDSCSFGNTQTAINFCSLPSSPKFINLIFRKCPINETVAFTNQSNLANNSVSSSVVAFDKFNNTSGSHRAYKQFGRTESDQSVYNTAAPSEALLPNSASGKLPSGSKKFAVASGQTATVNVYVRKSATYNGNQPRLIVKRNVIAGITTDTVLATSGANVPLLDTYTGAAGAYSLRKLRTAYTGSAIRVRRSNDNAEQDIGFDGNGNLDESALTTFVGANSGFVTTWYDQSGNDRHATQTTTANQPRIVNSGTVDKEGGKPAVVFDGTNDRLVNATQGFAVNNVTMTAVSSRRNSASANDFRPVFSTGILDTADGFGFLYRTSNVPPLLSQDAMVMQARNQNTTVVLTGNFTNTINTPNLVFGRTTSTQDYAWFNSTTSATSLHSRANVTSNRDITIGANAASSLFLNGTVQEIVFWEADFASDRTAIETNINNYYNLFPEWQELTGTTATVSDDCVLEVYVDCDGTAGTVNVDDWSIS